MVQKEIEIQPIHKPIEEEITHRTGHSEILSRVPHALDKLSDQQKATSFRIAQTMMKLPGVETRPQISAVLGEIVKTKGEAIRAAKAVVDEGSQVYSLEIGMKTRPVILTVSLDDKNNSTTILLTDKSAKVLEGFYNQSKA